MKKNVLIIRLSAMGDVALTVPVLKAAALTYPETNFTLLTRPKFTEVFAGIENISFVTPDFAGKHKGFAGLIRLFILIRKQVNPDRVIDVHDVLRTKILRILFSLFGVKSVVFDKGRNEKKNLVKSKQIKPLQHATERYALAFAKAGFAINLSDITYPVVALKNEAKVHEFTGEKNEIWIGIAPFASTKEKTYPLFLMQEVIKLLLQKPVTIIVFGGGKKEEAQTENLTALSDRVISAVSKLKIPEEMALMSQCDAFIAMDSANMHLARLCGIPTVSVWGATHPATGFGAMGYEYEQNAIQANLQEVTCRPCSVFGNKACYKNSWECFAIIQPSEIANQCLALLKIEN